MVHTGPAVCDDASVGTTVGTDVHRPAPSALRRRRKRPRTGDVFTPGGRTSGDGHDGREAFGEWIRAGSKVPRDTEVMRYI